MINMEYSHKPLTSHLDSFKKGAVYFNCGLIMWLGYRFPCKECRPEPSSDELVGLLSWVITIPIRSGSSKKLLKLWYICLNRNWVRNQCDQRPINFALFKITIKIAKLVWNMQIHHLMLLVLRPREELSQFESNIWSNSSPIQIRYM